MEHYWIAIQATIQQLLVLWPFDWGGNVAIALLVIAVLFFAGCCFAPTHKKEKNETVIYTEWRN